MKQFHVKMEMEQTPSKQMQGQGDKIERKHRSWSVKEEEALISAVKEIITNGWKCANGFRSGYLIVLERAMVKAFPATDLRAEPHLNSKLHVWKKYHRSLTAMLARRGISWNSKHNMINAQDDAWDLYLKVDSSARSMRYKSWPFHKDWCQIYGNDPLTTTEDLVDTDQVKMDTGIGKGKGKKKTADFGGCDEGLDYQSVILGIVGPKRSYFQRKKSFQIIVLMD